MKFLAVIKFCRIDGTPIKNNYVDLSISLNWLPVNKPLDIILKSYVQGREKIMDYKHDLTNYK